MQKSILIVDDDEAVLGYLGKLFRANGYRTYCAVDGDDALNVLKTEKVRVCFLDLRMPDMNGEELCRRIKKHDPGSRIYALSSYVGSFGEFKYHEMGFDGCFGKPVNCEQLLQAGRIAFEQLEKSESPRVRVATIPEFEPVSQFFTIQVPEGLHARPVAMMVKIISRFKSDVQICYGGKRVNARSVLGILSLGIGFGERFEMKAEGFDAVELLDAMDDLVRNQFQDYLPGMAPVSRNLA
ncbi:MAG: HPr family phosphocarrier protein [bacterium]